MDILMQDVAHVDVDYIFQCSLPCSHEIVLRMNDGTDRNIGMIGARNIVRLLCANGQSDVHFAYIWGRAFHPDIKRRHKKNEPITVREYKNNVKVREYMIVFGPDTLPLKNPLWWWRWYR